MSTTESFILFLPTLISFQVVTSFNPFPFNSFFHPSKIAKSTIFYRYVGGETKETAQYIEIKLTSILEKVLTRIMEKKLKKNRNNAERHAMLLHEEKEYLDLIFTIRQASKN